MTSILDRLAEERADQWEHDRLAELNRRFDMALDELRKWHRDDPGRERTPVRELYRHMLVGLCSEWFTREDVITLLDKAAAEAAQIVAEAPEHEAALEFERRRRDGEIPWNSSPPWGDLLT